MSIMPMSTFMSAVCEAEQRDPVWFHRFENQEALRLTADELNHLAETAPSEFLAGWLHARAGLASQGALLW
ncbi:MAG: hypothetical protein LW862_08970 [Rubrivivax sp.]|jgi:hypothetical protein|nr:hypothetical protein [Rubrivivax sp.]